MDGAPYGFLRGNDVYADAHAAVAKAKAAAASSSTRSRSPPPPPSVNPDSVAAWNFRRMVHNRKGKGKGTDKGTDQQ